MNPAQRIRVRHGPHAAFRLARALPRVLRTALMLLRRGKRVAISVDTY